jgi:hypothetical protein
MVMIIKIKINEEGIMKRSVIVLVCLAGLLGWFGVQAAQAQNHCSLMLDSGFKQWNVDTAKEKAFFAKHPTDKIMTYKKADAGKVVHVYKDPNTGVVYVGDKAALEAYLQKTKDNGMSPIPVVVVDWDPDFWTMWQDEHGAP